MPALSDRVRRASQRLGSARAAPAATASRQRPNAHRCRYGRDCCSALRGRDPVRATFLDDRAADRRCRPAFWTERDVTRRLQRRDDRREIVGDAPGWSHGQRSQQRQMVLWHNVPPVLGARGFRPAADKRPVTMCDRILRQLIGIAAAYIAVLAPFASLWFAPKRGHHPPQHRGRSAARCRHECAPVLAVGRTARRGRRPRRQLPIARACARSRH